MPRSTQRSFGRICTMPDCMSEHMARGYCASHYNKWRLYGDPLGRAGRHVGMPCSTCGTPYGRRLRCYVCKPGQRKTGLERACIVCGKTFYMQRNQVQLTNKGSGKYCSRECKHKSWVGVEKIKGTRYRRGKYMMVKTGIRQQELEHRLVMAEVIGRPLLESEHVHHVNGEGLDNRPTNLELWSVSHPPGQRVVDKVRWAREIINLYGELFPE